MHKDEGSIYSLDTINNGPSCKNEALLCTMTGLSTPNDKNLVEIFTILNIRIQIEHAKHGGLLFKYLFSRSIAITRTCLTKAWVFWVEPFMTNEGLTISFFSQQDKD
jgi:hypothetical protein